MRPWAGIGRFGGIGDNLIASSVLPLLSIEYDVEVVSQAPQSCVFENNPHVKKLVVKKDGEIPGDSPLAWQRWFADRAGEYDKFVHLSHSCETFVALTPGQTAYYWPQKFRQKLCNQSYLEIVHDIVGVPHEFNPRFYPTSAELKRALSTKAHVGPRVIGWCLAGSRLDKVYPYAAAAIARLIRELELPVLLFGAPGRDPVLAKEIGEYVAKVNGSTKGLHFAISPEPSTEWKPADGEGPIVISAAPEPLWPIRRALTQLMQCDLVIGPDTGAMWAVSMCAMPKIMLLSHASPENITKHWKNTVTLHADQTVPCWPCHKLIDNPKDCRPNADNNAAACISSISVETILLYARAAVAQFPLVPCEGEREEAYPLT